MVYNYNYDVRCCCCCYYCYYYCYCYCCCWLLQPVSSTSPLSFLLSVSVVVVTCSCTESAPQIYVPLHLFEIERNMVLILAKKFMILRKLLFETYAITLLCVSKIDD